MHIIIPLTEPDDCCMRFGLCMYISVIISPCTYIIVIKSPVIKITTIAFSLFLLLKEASFKETTKAYTYVHTYLFILSRLSFMYGFACCNPLQFTKDTEMHNT